MRVCKCGGTIRQHPLTDSREAWTCNACGRYEVIQRAAPASEKHTVGPWKAVKNNAGSHVDGANSLVVCSLENCDKEHRESNAKLIAAAPELLEALQAMLYAAHNDITPECDKARAAIEKATASPHPLLNFVDITGVPPTNTEVVVGMLKTAVKILENEDGSRAAWRIADAGLMMRDMLTNRKEKDVCGFDRPTEMGAILPSHDRA